MSGSLSLAWPWALLALALPLLIRFGLPPLRPARALSHEGFARLFVTPRRGEWRAALVWGAFILALCRPLWRDPPSIAWQPSRDLLVAIDLSDSMRAEDMLDEGRQMSRLAAVKQRLARLIQARPGDRIALIVFADHAYLLSPLTRDHQALLAFGEELDFDLVGRTTALGEAIALARAHQDGAHPGALLLITDGRNTSGDAQPQEQARLAAAEGMVLYTLGVGADPDTPLLPANQRDPSAELDEPLLREIARLGHGRYFRVRSMADLAEMQAALDRLEPTARPLHRMSAERELYPWPLALALLLLAWPRRRSS
ncbi:VWA domain-containing protein [Aeromonas schubertii]|uniref:VWA domain-containing protein n=1 Tax=Aeromonas schubertii TaxID=652 RepID=UPI001CC59FD4|nr:VWA domain-containing protein [Aeromonas schubertii]MBZ6074443.1 VWA domain-containing protein [Aeromonas schubertii]